MFLHQKELQFEAKPDKPNPLIAKVSSRGLIGVPVWREIRVCSNAVSLPKVGAAVEGKVQKIC